MGRDWIRYEHCFVVDCVVIGQEARRYMEESRLYRRSRGPVTSPPRSPPVHPIGARTHFRAPHDLEPRPDINPLDHPSSSFPATSRLFFSLFIMPAIYTPQFNNEFFTGQVPINTGLFIDGKWVEGSSGTFIEYVIPVIGPRLVELTLPFPS